MTEVRVQGEVSCKCGSAKIVPGGRVGTLAGGGVVDRVYCFECNTLLEIVDEGVRVTPMVPRVDSEAVRATRLWKKMTTTFRTNHDMEAMALLGLYDATPGEHEGIPFTDYSESDDYRVILAALQQSALALAEWLADQYVELIRSLENCDGCIVARCRGLQSRGDCQRRVMKAALAATGATATDGPSADAMLDALDAWTGDDTDKFKANCGDVILHYDRFHDVWAIRPSDARKLAKALLNPETNPLLAQAANGGGDRG